MSRRSLQRWILDVLRGSRIATIDCRSLAFFVSRHSSYRVSKHRVARELSRLRGLGLGEHFDSPAGWCLTAPGRAEAVR